MFNAVQKENQPLAERVAEQIAQLIQERELKEGDRLPNEFDLAQELGVGRGTIREAVKQLVARNILTIQRGKGTFVTQNPGIVEDPFGFNYEQDQQKLGLDLLEIRMVIEPWIAQSNTGGYPRDLRPLRSRRASDLSGCAASGRGYPISCGNCAGKQKYCCAEDYSCD